MDQTDAYPVARRAICVSGHTLLNHYLIGNDRETHSESGKY
jgi:hypothetical protein